MVLIKKRIVVADGNMSPDILWKVLNKQPAVHGGEKTIEDIGEVEDKDCDDAEPLQVDLELVVEAEEAQVDDNICECHTTKLQNVQLSAKTKLLQLIEKLTTCESKTDARINQMRIDQLCLIFCHS